MANRRYFCINGNKRFWDGRDKGARVIPNSPMRVQALPWGPANSVTTSPQDPPPYQDILGHLLRRDVCEMHCDNSGKLLTWWALYPVLTARTIQVHVKLFPLTGRTKTMTSEVRKERKLENIWHGEGKAACVGTMASVVSFQQEAGTESGAREWGPKDTRGQRQKSEGRSRKEEETRQAPGSRCCAHSKREVPGSTGSHVWPSITHLPRASPPT